MRSLPYFVHSHFDQITKSIEAARFCHLGRDPQTGFDCLGHLVWVHARLGFPVNIPPQGRNYSRRFWDEGINQIYLEKLREQFDDVPERARQKGDVVVFYSRPGRHIVVHSGILIDRDTFQHAYHKRGVSYNRLTDRFWSDRVAGFMRHKKFGEDDGREAELSKAPLRSTF